MAIHRGAGILGSFPPKMLGGRHGHALQSQADKFKQMPESLGATSRRLAAMSSCRRS